MLSKSFIASALLALAAAPVSGDCAAENTVAAAAGSAAFPIKCQSFSYERFDIACSQRKIAITVRTNPTTGFDWHFRNYDETRLKVNETRYEPLNKDPLLAGAPSTGIYEAELVADGKTVFDFVYMRDWEGGERSDAYRFDVTAENDGSITIESISPIKEL